MGLWFLCAMVKAITIWSGDEWQEHFVLLARTHYGPGNFVCVPDKDRGDFGLEGFSKDGSLFQCYAAEEPCTPDKLYEKQRDKITTDLNKFKDNQPQLKKMLGDVKISKWILSVPHFDTKRLLDHVTTKTAEMRALNLPCAAADFCVCIEDDGCFAVEKSMLLKEGIGRIHIRAVPVESGEVSEWTTENTGLIDIMDGKLKKLPALVDDDNRKNMKANLVKRYLEGQNILSQLHDDYPQLYQDVAMCKTHREDQLIFECSISAGSANETLNDALAKFRAELQTNVRGIQNYTIDDIAMEAVADWLFRCHLHFPSTAA